MVIAILARGSSLERINKLKEYDIDTCVLVNKFNEELTNPLIYDFVKDKKVIHMCNAPQKLLTKSNYNKLNFEYFVCCSLYSKRKTDNCYLKMISYNKRIKYINEDFFDVSYCREIDRSAPSTGLVSVEYTTTEMNQKDIYLIGIDFHEAPYLTNKDARNIDSNGWWIDRRRDIYVREMNIWFNWWAKTHPNVKFHLITNSKTRHNLPNVEYLDEKT